MGLINPFCAWIKMWLFPSVLCRMKMLPVMISANYHSSARSAVSESPNSSARLVSQCPNSSARLVFPIPQLERATRFPMSQLERATRFPNVPSRACNSLLNCQFEVCVFDCFCHSMPFIRLNMSSINYIN